jgi:hypothetical protein
MPTLTPSDALIRAANNLTNAIAGIIPPPNIITDAIDQLINIFKLQAEKEKDVATAQRVLKEHAQVERVGTKTKDHSPSTAPAAKPTTTTVTTPMSFPPLEVEYSDLNTGMLQEIPMTSQDKMGNNLSPAALASSGKYKLSCRIIFSFDGHTWTPTTVRQPTSCFTQVSSPIPL